MNNFLGVTFHNFIQIGIVNQFILFNSQGLLRVTCQDMLHDITYFFCFFLPLSVTPEIEYITKFTNRLVKETKMQLGEIAHLLPEQIHGGNRGA